MMEEDSAVVVKNISKDFRLPQERTRTVKAAFTGLFRKKGKKEIVQHALKNISFDIKKGEFFGIVGRNGSGKSTLLKILAGIYQPTKGEVAVRGKLVPFIELGVGFNPELTGRENVYLNGAMLGFSKKEVEAMYSEIVEFAELGDFMDQRLKNYSSGMQVRLAFSMAIRAKAEILLVDEVLAVGDASFQRKCFDYFQELKANRTTVVFVTHDMGAVRQYCDRVVLIDNAERVDIGDPDSIAKEYLGLFATSENKPSIRKTRSTAFNERWGDGVVTYKTVETKVARDGTEIVVDAKVTTSRDVLDPTFGIMVANQAKQPILGTNTVIEEARIAPLKTGQELSIQWRFPNIFNEGRYYVELTIMHKSVSEVADWWEGASSFEISNNRHTPYIVNPPQSFSVKY